MRTSAGSLAAAVLLAVAAILSCEGDAFDVEADGSAVGGGAAGGGGMTSEGAVSDGGVPDAATSSGGARNVGSTSDGTAGGSDDSGMGGFGNGAGGEGDPGGGGAEGGSGPGSSCPPAPVVSYAPCESISEVCVYGDMSCVCVDDGGYGTWRCSGCPPSLPVESSCFSAGVPLDGCAYGNATCTCSEDDGWRCAGGCLAGWFSITDTSGSAHVHEPLDPDAIDEIVRQVNVGNPFVVNLPVINEHSHGVPFLSTTCWGLGSGLAPVEGITTGLGDGHEWTVECTP